MASNVLNRVAQAKTNATRAATEAYQSGVKGITSSSGTSYFSQIFSGNFDPSSIFSILFIGAIITFVIFSILIVVHFTMFPVFSFSPNDLGFITIPTPSDKTVAFDDKCAAKNQVAEKIKGVKDHDYTISADVFLTGTFTQKDAPNVLLYRGTAPVTDSESAAPATTDTVGSKYPNTNILVWLDPMKNDLYVSVKKVDGTFVHTNPVENLPVRKVIALAIVISSAGFVEVYINGKLQQTANITGGISGCEDSFYSPTTTAQQSVNIANLSYWPRVLTAREINVSAASPTFKEDKFKAC